ncbi:hypothetical protein, partial [Halomicronema sp. CCY15110]|uniref:hypothetical protein n=1 Tax=Halomicronema sp. CCY15110 TaxID=2767773 RepID=UPI001952217D
RILHLDDPMFSGSILLQHDLCVLSRVREGEGSKGKIMWRSLSAVGVKGWVAGDLVIMGGGGRA